MLIALVFRGRHRDHNVVTNAAAAAILTPVAVEVAQDAGLNPAIC